MQLKSDLNVHHAHPEIYFQVYGQVTCFYVEGVSFLKWFFKLRTG